MSLSIDASILLYPNWSGVQIYAYHILDEMTRLRPDVTFHLLCDGEATDPRLDSIVSRPNVARHNHRGNLLYHALLPWDVLRLHSRAYYSLSSRLKTPLPCPGAIIIHDCGWHMLPEHYGNMEPEASRVRAGRHLRKLSLIVTVSETVKAEIIRLFDVPPERVVVAPNAAERPDPNAPDEKPKGLPDNASFFLMVNPGRSYKNWADALSGFSSYLVAHPGESETRLVLAGDLREETKPIQEMLARDAPLSCQVSCLGYVSEPELRYLYRHARLLLMPSLYEGFGIPALEAMSYDLPVIVSDIPVLREVTQDAALHVPVGQPELLAQAMARLNKDESLRRGLIDKGKTRLDAYSWRESAKTTLDALLSLVSKR